MRDFLDAILSFIEAETLTDEEFETVTVEEEEYSFEVYEALRVILAERESISTTLDRLKAYFDAKGVDFSAIENPASSQIYIGSDLS
jgi:hypothetical protein